MEVDAYMQAVDDVIYTIVFGCIAVTKDLIDCNSPVDYKSLANYASLMIQKVAVETLIVLVAGRVTALDEGFGFVVLLVHQTMCLLVLLVHLGLV